MNALIKLTVGFLPALCAAQSVAGSPATARKTLTSDDFYRIQDVSDPRVSPDGRWVAYVVTTNDRRADEARSAIWMVSWDGGQQLALTAAADGTGKPRWSPDGRYLAFIAKPPGAAKAQLMLMDRRGGDARQLSKVDGDIGDYAWAPDGKRLVYTMVPDDAGVAPKPIVIDALHFKEDGDGYLRQGRVRHLYMFDVDTKRSEPLTADPEFNDDLPAWSPDGRQIAFVRTKVRSADRDGQEEVAVIDAGARAAARGLARLYAPNAQRLAWSPDGKLIAYLQGGEPKINAYMQDHLFVMPAAGGAPRPLAGKLDRAVTSYVFTADSAAIRVAVEDDRDVYPALIDLRDGAITRDVDSGSSVVSALSSAGGHTALLETNDGAPAEVYALEAGKLRKLTRQNDAWLAGLHLGAVEDIRFNSKGGAEIHGLIVKPPGFVAGRKYPMLLWIHGGPNGQSQHSLILDGYEFEPQIFAAEGYVVLLVNYRGSSGRGLAFAASIFADWGHKEVQDLLAGVDYLVGTGLVDPARLAIGGWSYGGILTDYTIATDRRFKAAISGAGSADQIAMYGSDQYILQYNAELGPPWRNTALWLKVSYPFFHADRIHTPTLFLGGDKDFNVPINGGEQMYESLRTLGVPAQLVVYPGENHVFTRPSFIKDLADRMSAWLRRYLPAPR